MRGSNTAAKTRWRFFLDYKELEDIIQILFGVPELSLISSCLSFVSCYTSAVVGQLHQRVL